MKTHEKIRPASHISRTPDLILEKHEKKCDLYAWKYGVPGTFSPSLSRIHRPNEQKEK